MPTEFPQRRPRNVSNWQIMSLALGYLGAMLVIGWIAVERTSPPAQAITTGIAPANQSGKPSIE